MKKFAAIVCLGLLWTGFAEAAAAQTSLTISPTSLAYGTAGIPYSETLVPGGGSGSGYNFSINSGAAGLTGLGLNLTPATGVISGTPTAGTATFTVQLTDSLGNTTSQAYVLAVNSVTVLHSFTGGADGDAPNSLIQASDGSYYGTTAFGGNAGSCTDINGATVGCGTVFRLSNGTVTVLYNFGGGGDGGYPTGVIQGPDGNLYGTTAFGGTSITANTACTDTNGGNNGVVDPNKGNPEPCCVDSGGDNIGCGTLYTISPSQPPLPGQIQVLMSFDGPSKGAFPNPLTLGLASDAVTPVLYGSSQTCSYCVGNASLFSFDPLSNTFESLSFGASGLSFPNSLVQGECNNGENCDLNLYGTAQLGGDNCSSSNIFGCGGLFEYDFKTKEDSQLCTFGESNNSGAGFFAAVSPAGKRSKLKPETVTRQTGSRFPFDLEWSFNSVPVTLTEASDGSIFGTTPWACFSGNGGYSVGAGCGTGTDDVAVIFQCQPPPSGSTSWTLNTVYPFTGESVPGGNVSGATDGGGSLAGLTLAGDGQYYGSSGYGIFQIPASEVGPFLSSNISNPPPELAALNPFAQMMPAANPDWMIQGSDGNFYVISSTGGSASDGAIYKVAPPATISPAVQVVITPPQITLGGSATLNWSVANAFSLTAQQCYTYSRGPSDATEPGSWAGPKAGTFSGSVNSGSVTIQPNAAGAYTYALTCGGIATGFAPLQVNPALSLSPSALSAITAGTPYLQTLTANGGSGTGYEFSISQGAASLAALGLSFSAATDAISGTPTSGTASFTVQVTDSLNDLATQAYTLTVNPAPSFTLASAAPTLAVVQGSSNTDALTINSANGFSGSVTLSATGLPSGVTASFGTNPATGSSLITLTATNTAATGPPVTVTITGTSGSLTASATVALTVNPAPSFALAPATSALVVVQGSSNTDTVMVTAANGFSGSVTLSASGLPSGVTASFGTNPATGSSILTLTATNAAATGPPLTVTITGTSGSLTASATIALTVTAAPTFVVADGNSTLSILPGATTGNTVTITVTPSNGFTGTVNLTCSITPTAASDSPTCTLSPSSVTITGAGAQSSTLTIITTAATNAKNQVKRLLWPSAGTAVALLLFGIPRRRRNWPAIVAVLMLSVTLSMIGCGGGGGSTIIGQGGGNPGTTAGTYIVTVTGNSGSITGTVGTVTLTVQ